MSLPILLILFDLGQQWLQKLQHLFSFLFIRFFTSFRLTIAFHLMLRLWDFVVYRIFAAVELGFHRKDIKKER